MELEVYEHSEPFAINQASCLDFSLKVIYSSNNHNPEAERELSSRLRREQDEAFRASLEMDRARARERAAAAEAEERLAREAAEARKREALLARAVVRRQRRWVASLPQEPSGGSDTVRHSIKLPNGTRAQRVFPITDSLKPKQSYQEINLLIYKLLAAWLTINSVYIIASVVVLLVQVRALKSNNR
ncbi:hypothetical protein ACTXT7_001277 [Hymenolepis weldensis]